MVHCGSVKQTAQIMQITPIQNNNQSKPFDEDKVAKGLHQVVLRTGDRALVQFKFIVRPEFLIPDSRLLFREGTTKGVGKSKI